MVSIFPSPVGALAGSVIGFLVAVYLIMGVVEPFYLSAMASAEPLTNATLIRGFCALVYWILTLVVPTVTGAFAGSHSLKSMLNGW
jgi:hypothetical protein